MWSDLGVPKTNKIRDFDFKFHIQKYNDVFGIKIGMSWDAGLTHNYIPLELTAFADFCPLTKLEWKTNEEAVEALRRLRKWMVALHNAQPNCKEWIKQNIE